MDTRPVLEAVESHLRIHQITDHRGTIAQTLVGLLIGYGVRTEAEATRRLALFAGDLAAEWD